jgi:AraC-like DNA-binding protein
VANFPEGQIDFKVLYESPLIAVSDYNCRIERGGPQAEEQNGGNSIVLMRHGAFCKHFGKKNVTATVNQSVFFAKNSEYRVSHPADCGDRGTIFNLSPRILKDIVRELDPAVDERPEYAFPFITGPCDNQIFWRHREFVTRLEKAEASAEADQLEPLWADVTAIQLMADVLESAYKQHGVTRKHKRSGTSADHAERTEAAKTYMAGRIGERITLDDVARAVHSSPFNFARIFQQQAGLPVHRYLTQLRLRASLEQLAKGADDITALALDLGFSSHSHFTETFRREFGCTPSEARRNSFPEMSKNLIV